jgi:3-dehydroquinate synthase
MGATIIRRSIQGMLEELEYNLWEAILVRLVDYGHTVSPELEMAALRWGTYTVLVACETRVAVGCGVPTLVHPARVLTVSRQYLL